jgi:CrcB protein
MTPTKNLWQEAVMLGGFLIGLGGFIGAVMRYTLGGWIQAATGSYRLPFGTLGVNVLGSFLIGVLATLVRTRGLMTAETRGFVLIGMLGALTTFSTFSYETLGLARDGALTSAAANVLANVVLCLLFVWLGRALALSVWR